jgi:hypothetical protein
MENNIWPSGPFNPDQTNRASAVKENSIENFQEFKHCVLLHEKGIQMQDCITRHSVVKSRVKSKNNSHLSRTNQSDVLSDNIKEVDELRMQFKERHQ